MLIEISDNLLINSKYILYVTKKRLNDYVGPRLKENEDKINIIITMIDGEKCIKKFVDKSKEMKKYWKFIYSFNDKTE